MFFDVEIRCVPTLEVDFQILHIKHNQRPYDRTPVTI